MKKRFLLIASLLALSNEALIAQQNPTPYTTPFANTPAQAVTTANAAWYRGGNNNTGPAGNANIFGTLWNSPIYTQTAGVNRIRLNGNLSTNIDATGNLSRNGYMGLGSFFNGGVNYWTNNSPFSQLHLVGRNGNFIQDNGNRQWMQGGISFKDNNDFSYIGIRQVGNTLDATEMVFNLSDNSEADDFVFRFSGGQDFATIENDFNFYFLKINSNSTPNDIQIL